MTLGIILAVAAAVSYTFNTLFLTLLGRKAGITATKYIFLIALAANLLIHVGLYGRLSANTTRLTFATAGIFLFAASARQRIHIRTRDFNYLDWLKVAMAALIGPVLSVFLNFNALKYISLGISSAMLQLSPVLMLFLSRIVFKERIKTIAIIGTALAVSGTISLILH